ncbi:hypothetical protein [Dipodfec virus UOA04_Rod_809]|nr:hypothetical protein [Dipodfec virus UOA04_Rod_809]
MCQYLTNDEYPDYEPLGSRIARQIETHEAEESFGDPIYDISPDEAPTGEEPIYVDPIFRDPFQTAESTVDYREASDIAAREPSRTDSTPQESARSEDAPTEAPSAASSSAPGSVVP